METDIFTVKSLMVCGECGAAKSDHPNREFSWDSSGGDTGFTCELCLNEILRNAEQRELDDSPILRIMVAMGFSSLINHSVMPCEYRDGEIFDCGLWEESNVFIVFKNGREIASFFNPYAALGFCKDEEKDHAE